MTDAVLVGSAGITAADVVRAARELATVELSPEVEATIVASRAVVDRAVAGERLIYGLNTGLGHMRDHRVPLDVLQRYQRQMIEAHASGIGPPLDTEDVRAAMLARVAGAARGGSGLTLETVRLLVAMLNAGVHPVVPSAGSVGAGDLMHMAAIAAVLIGKGDAELHGELLPAEEALARAGLTPIVAQPKEGLALVSSNGVAIGAGALVAEEALRLARLADLACALSLEAVRGNPGPFDEEAAGGKAIPGQVAAAAGVRTLLEGSYLHDPATVLSVQDPLSFRVAPQVNGAYREQVLAAEHAVEVELNGIGDNPMVLIERDTMISNGNFQPMQLALAFDALRTGAAHVAMISERRMNKVMTIRFSDPKLMLAGLTDEEMAEQRPRRALVQYAAAALLAELKHLAAPVSIHLPPLDLDVEDHGTVAPSVVFTTRRALTLLDTILTCEAQLAIDLMDTEGVPALGRGTREAYERVQASWSRLPADGPPAAVVEATRAALR
ncbi:MAG: histidine ammonia-lyase [Gaiellales bacterium]|nr:histidine ammonia-lyase [Gaiellales bacterium]